MAVVVVAASIALYTADSPLVERANLTFGPWVDRSTPGAWLLNASSGSATLTDNAPVEAEAAVAISGVRAASFLDDFYNRIHVLPSRIDLGNLLTTQTRDVEVWNAHFAPKLLSNVDEFAADGMVLSEPEAAPTIFAAVESRTYSLNISTNGAPVVDAVFTFVFPDESPTLVLSGRRVVVWPFMPQTEHSESLEWKTDIVRSFAKEQRLALRAAPRQEFSYNYQLDESQYSRAKAITTQWAHRVYGVPVWAEATRLGAVAIGTSALIFDTRNADYRSNDILLLWESDSKFAALETLDVTDGGVTLRLPTDVAFGNAYVTPLRFARTWQGMAYKRTSRQIVTAGASFAVTSNADLGADVGYTKYRGKDVLLERQVVLGDLSERISRSIDLQDNGAGPVLVDIQTNFVTHAQTITFDTLDRGSRWTIRKWLHARRGRQKSFWLPSWNPDLIPVEDVGVATAALSVRPIGFPLYYGVRDIMLQLRNGTRLFNRVLTSSTDSNLNETLILESAFGVAFTPGDVDFICLLSHVRLNSDTVEIHHGFGGRSSITIPVVETPE